MNPLFANAQHALQTMPFTSAQKLQIFHSRIERTEVEFVKEVLTVHLSVKALLLVGVNFPDPKLITEFVLNLRHSEIVSLEMSEFSVPEADIVCLAAVIQETKLRTLELRSVGVTDRGVAALASALHHCYSLRVLKLCGNQIGGLGLMAIAPKLYDSSINNLDLGNNHLGAEAIGTFVRYLPRCSLRQLQLRNVQMGNEGFQALCDVLPQCVGLECLDVAQNGLEQECANRLALVINQCRTLRLLDLSHNRLSSLEPLSKVLGANAVLEQLEVCGNRIQNDSLIEFGNLVLVSHPTLVRMGVSGNQLLPTTVSWFQKKLARLHDPRSKVMCTLASMYTIERLRHHSRFGQQIPCELVRMVGAML